MNGRSIYDGLTNDEKEWLGIMTDEQLDKAITVLGPKLVNSIMRMSLRQIEDFDSKITEMIEERKNDKTKCWYKQKQWQEV